MLRELITKITEITLNRQENNQLNKVLGKDEGGDIMNWTGPGIFTDTVFDYMNAILQSPEVITGKYKWETIIDWKVLQEWNNQLLLMMYWFCQSLHSVRC